MPPERYPNSEFQRYLFQWDRESFWQSHIALRDWNPPPQRGQQLFLRRMRKIMQSKGYNLADHECDLWNAWRAMSAPGRRLWALEETRDAMIEMPFLELLKRLPEEWMTTTGIYVLTYREIRPAVSKSEFENEDYWVQHYFESIMLNLIADALSGTGIQG